MKERDKIQQCLQNYLLHKGLPAYTFPNSFPISQRRFGDSVILHQTAAEGLFSSFWQQFHNDADLWQRMGDTLKANKIAVIEKIQNDNYRTPAVHLKLGHDPWISHKENGIHYTWHLHYSMFCCGNITEKQRIASWCCQDDIIVDLFAGIGYFTLTYLLHARAKHVYACEWNANAVCALEKNLALNRAGDRCTVLLGDNRSTAPKRVAQRVNLGLIPSSQISWRIACLALDPTTGGWLHVHGNVDAKSMEYNATAAAVSEDDNNISCNKKASAAWLAWAQYVQQSIQALFVEEYGHHTGTTTWSVCARHIEHVKQYAPKVDHLVVDVLCRPMLQL